MGMLKFTDVERAALEAALKAPTRKGKTRRGNLFFLPTPACRDERRRERARSIIGPRAGEERPDVTAVMKV